MVKIITSMLFMLFSMQSFSGELVSWSKNVEQNFDVNGCVTIPGTPGVAGHCTPSESVPYPCPTWNHPTKVCHHTVSGICSPSIPAGPDLKKCESKNLGTFGIKVDGGVFTSVDGISDTEISVQNTVSVDLFSKHIVIPMSCKVSAGTKSTVCLNMLTGTFAKSNASGASCEIGGLNLAGITYPGVTANLCTDFDFNISGGKPVGSVAVRVVSDIEFGSVDIAGHNLSLGNKSWNPTLFKMPLP